MGRTSARLLLVAMLAWSATVNAAPASVWKPAPLPAEVWQTLQATPGIEFGGSPGLSASVQVICDVHCPYCAKLYITLRDERPALRVRWVPIAYFQPDSDRIAAAILASPDPALALDRNYRDYDKATRRGAHQPSGSRRMSLAPPHAELKREWSTMGGYTPMVIALTADGSVLKAAGSTEAFLNPVLDQAAPSVKEYRSW